MFFYPLAVSIYSFGEKKTLSASKSNSPQDLLMENNNNTSMTALVSLFSRAYHTKRSVAPVYCDELAEKLMTKEEYETVAFSMKNGAAFFFPGFDGTPDEALDKIVNTRLAPSVVSRSAFCFDALKNSVMLGAKQLVLLGSGYDSMPYREEIKEKLKVFELDRKEMTEDKLLRLERANIAHDHISFVPCDLSKDFESELLSAGFKKDELSFVSMLGLCHYLDESSFSSLLKKLSALLCEGCDVVFDYPLKTFDEEKTVTEKLAAGAGETMKTKYSYSELEKLLAEHGFKIYEHLSKDEIDERFFAPHNAFTSGTGVMTSPGDFALCRAVKK